MKIRILSQNGFQPTMQLGREGGEGCMSRQGGSLLIGFFHQISGNTFNIHQTDSFVSDISANVKLSINTLQLRKFLKKM